MRALARPFSILAATILVSAASLSASTEEQSSRRSQAPQFKDYPATPMQSAKAPLVMNERDRNFRTRYRRLHNDSPSFAGHFGIHLVGCGTGCVSALIIDYRTGKPVDLEFARGEEVASCSEDYADESGNRVEKGWYFRPDSRLLVVGGSMPGLECGARFYLEQEGKMIHLKDIPIEKSP